MKLLADTFAHPMNFQVVPDDMADKLFAACGSDSFEKLDSTVKVSIIMIVVLYHACLLLCLQRRKKDGSSPKMFISRVQTCTCC